MRILVVIATLVISSISILAQADSLTDDFVNTLYGMKAVYRAQYAPAEWKKKYAGYDLDQQFNKDLGLAQQNPNLAMNDVRDILKDFIYSMRDYHTSIQFESTEAASLGFVVQGAGDDYFIADIDRNKLSE